MTTKKTGVLLIQLGTPDSPSTGDVRRFLATVNPSLDTLVGKWNNRSF